MAALDKKYDAATINQLQKWLEKLYGNEPCPTIQPDMHNIENLLKIKARNEQAEKQVREEINMKTQLAKFYNQRSEEIKCLVEYEGVSLSVESVELINSIADLGAKLNLEVPDLTNFLVAIRELKNTTLKNQEQKMVDSYRISSLSKKVTRVEATNAALKRNLEAAEETVNIQEPNAVKLEKAIQFLKLKQQEYKKDSARYQNYFSKIGLNPLLKHGSLVEKSKEVEELEDKLKKLNTKLEKYMALPPNETLVKLEVEKKKEELMVLEKEFAEVLKALEKQI